MTLIFNKNTKETATHIIIIGGVMRVKIIKFSNKLKLNSIFYSPFSIIITFYLNLNQFDN